MKEKAILQIHIKKQLHRKLSLQLLYLYYSFVFHFTQMNELLIIFIIKQIDVSKSGKSPPLKMIVLISLFLKILS